LFLTFHEMDFGWASKLVHFVLCFQLECKKKFEMWSLVDVQPARFSMHKFEHITGMYCDYVKNFENMLVEVINDMKVFWEQMGVNLKRGPNNDELIAACKNWRTWSREDQLHVWYLAIYTSFIQAPSTSTPAQASLPRLVMDLDACEDYLWERIYYDVPEFTAGFGEPLENKLSIFLLAFVGSKDRKMSRKIFRNMYSYSLYVL
ncbi:hypothetical protein N665_4261s0002, partial [Sinapis alba]